MAENYCFLWTLYSDRFQKHKQWIIPYIVIKKKNKQKFRRASWLWSWFVSRRPVIPPPGKCPPTRGLGTLNSATGVCTINTPRSQGWSAFRRLTAFVFLGLGSLPHGMMIIAVRRPEGWSSRTICPKVGCPGLTEKPFVPHRRSSGPNNGFGNRIWGEPVIPPTMVRNTRKFMSTKLHCSFYAFRIKNPDTKVKGLSRKKCFKNFYGKFVACRHRFFLYPLIIRYIEALKLFQ
jgi:hypothetical protein